MKNPSIDEEGWELEDMEVHARNYPGTFVLLPLEVRRSIQPGAVVKLAFRLLVENEGEDAREAMERMWVRVTRNHPDSYEGLLDNNAQYCDFMVSGAEVVFEPRHIIAVWTDES